MGVADKTVVSLAVNGTIRDVAVALAVQRVVMTYHVDSADSVVRGFWLNRPAREVLDSVASQLGSECVVIDRPGGVYYVGEPSQTDLAVRMYAMPTQNAEAWISVMRMGGSERVEVTGIGDRLVVRDSVRGIKNIERLASQLREVRAQYSMDVTFVELSRKSARDLGIDWSLDGGIKVAGTVDAGKWNGAVDLTAILEGILAANETGTDVAIVSTARLHVVEGEEATLQVGDTVPVPRRVVSAEGNSAVVGYDYVDSGVLLRASVMSLEDGGLRVELEPEISTVSGFVLEVPILSRRRLSSSLVLGNGGTVVLGGLEDAIDSLSVRGLPGLIAVPRKEDRADTRKLYIFITLNKVG